MSCITKFIVDAHFGHRLMPADTAWRGRSALSPSFASDLGKLMELNPPAFWVHGHAHDGFHYQARDRRVAFDPRGYGNENPLFKPPLVVEV